MHRRLPETQQVKISSLVRDEDFVADERLVRTYESLSRGKIKVTTTRIATSQIASAYYRRNSDGSVEYISNLKDSGVAGLQQAIRAGVRPSLDLQWNPHAPNGGGYVCADDEHSLAAYKSLNISLVPCRILRPKPLPGTEAALWLEPKGELPKLAKTIPPVLDRVPTYLGESKPSPREALPFLRSICIRVMDQITEFHVPGNYDLHYHEMLHAVVRRHARAIDTIIDLIEKGRREHALAICRLGYEAFLNFYLDWLSPQLIGPRLQLIAELRKIEQPGSSDQNPAWNVLTNFPGLLENASEKARLSPLGSWFHNAVYPSLSLIVHQSYSGIELEANNFDAEIAESEERFSDALLVRCLDMLTAALLARVENDVGECR